MSVIVKSGVPGKVPTAAQLDYGQLALNYADQKIYFKNSSNVVVDYGADPSISSLNTGQLAGLRNKIINGKMEIAQRGTSFPAIASGAYSLDRWWVVTDSVGTVNASQVDVSTTGIGFSKAIRVERTAGANRWNIGQNLETSDVIQLRGKKVTLSFLVRKGAALTSNLAVFFGTSLTEAKFGSAVDYVLTSVPNASISTSAFTSFSFTLDIPSNSTAPGFFIQFQCDQAGAANAFFDITGVQLEVDSVATPFEHRPIGMELALCQRYYFRTSTSQASVMLAAGVCVSSTQALHALHLPVSMRVAPTSLEQSGTASDYQLRGAATLGCSAVPIIGSSTPEVLQLLTTVASGLTAGHAALLRPATTSGFIGVPAEL